MTTTKVYFAGPYEAGPEIEGFARKMDSRFDVVSTWHHAQQWNPSLNGQPMTVWARRAAEVDAREVLSADVLVTFPDAERGQGHHVELGIALGAGKLVVAMVNGAEIGMFYWHPRVIRVSGYPQVVATLDAYRAGAELCRR